jgi:hypothetical protein
MAPRWPAAPGDVQQRSEWPRRGQVVAAADEDTGAVADLLGEGGDQGGLADPGFAADDHESPRALLRRGEGGRQAVEEQRPFEQLHDRRA